MKNLLNVVNKKFYSITIVGVLVLIMMLFYSNAFAIEYGGFGGRPAYPNPDNPRTESIFVHTLNIGDVQKEGILVVNNTASPKTILVYAVDSTPSTGGSFACAQKSVVPSDVGKWIKLKKSEVTLKSNTNEIVPFTITVPKNAGVGEHNGCIVVQEKKEKSKASGISLSFRTGLRVAITIPGELTRKIEIMGFNVTKRDDGGFNLNPLVKNTGNVSIDADVQVVTRSLLGFNKIKSGGQYPILRGDTSDWNFEFKKPFLGGLYHSSFAIEYDQNAGASVGVKSGAKLVRLKGTSVWFFSFPKLLGLIIEIVILLFIAFGIFLLLLQKKRKNWIKENWIDYEVQHGEDINSISKQFNVSWKLMAKVNKLTPPYALNTGEKIKVPPTE